MTSTEVEVEVAVRDGLFAGSLNCLRDGVEWTGEA
jgi:hypothetical protein